ncbi:hypothetical protein CIL05_16160 [Virgibacillus profundi]|uniref:DUF2232 domain-containing protein n=1 Tax=Virgibacillus profundi TaxID=2024555 RepID=A0A2A2I9R8_9BACI|nr:YybS family protein [Virgibacillus profundi]PAV28469.1 hypothetical protein CIL05_16160 [Virgibacillus profundi]PXY52642.1 DUF2232 domain-containing protein [Virgibacillus profundi]
MNQSRKLTDGALLTAIFMMLLIVSIYIPVFVIVLPLPFIIFASRHNWKPSLLMFAVVLVLTAIFTNVLSISLPILMGVGGIMIGSAMFQKSSAYETWARGTLGFIAGLLFVFVFSQIMFDINWVDEFEQTVTESMEMSSSILEEIGVGEQTDELKEAWQGQIAVFKDLFPAGLVMIALVMAFISQWIGYKVVNRLEKKKYRFPPFRTLRFPTSIVWVYFFALVFSFFDIDQSSIFYTGINNLLVLTGLLMTIQGFSFIFFYAHHKKMSKVFPIIIVIVTLIFPMLLLYLVRILGIIDIGFGIRDRMTKKEK